MHEQCHRILGMCLALMAFSAKAEIGLEAPRVVGHVVYATGKAWVIGEAGKRPAASADVAEGETLQTGLDGHIYLRTQDGGFFILRPNSRGRVIRYRTQAEAREFRLELESGLSRVVTGSGAKEAPERFRFNTPVAAIGVRGTDFTVQASQDATRAWVESGRIVLASFGESCSPLGLGPCSGNNSIDLAPGETQAAEVRRDVPKPRPLPLELQPPQASNGQKDSIRAVSMELPAAPAETAMRGLSAQPEPSRSLRWGRWQAYADAPANIDLKTELASGAELTAIGPIHALVRDLSPAIALPREGRIDFALAEHEGFYLHERSGMRVPASASQASLTVDFLTRRFFTALTLNGQDEPATEIRAVGSIEPNGHFVSDTLTTSHVVGALGTQPNREAAFLYQKRLDADRLVAGATFWKR